MSTSKPQPPRLADADHQLVRDKAQRLTRGETTVKGKLSALFYYVRDEIAFGFPGAGDLVPASETIRLGMGQCNTKGTLLLALCKAVDIPARLHFSLIRKEIQRGLFTGLAYRLMPDQVSHSWLEVQVAGSWRRIDAYINDAPFFLAGLTELRARGWDTGFSISCPNGNCNIELNLEREAFVQMDAVTDDHGVWGDPADYYASDKYANRPNLAKLLAYRLMIGQVNGRVAALRETQLRAEGKSSTMRG
ncbi:MAG: transglutaminase family protein [Chloroflexi bacterium]|nr:transglutaminase family protein [Chloroflexota bacterium]